jgi:hypothetical protein
MAVHSNYQKKAVVTKLNVSATGDYEDSNNFMARGQVNPEDFSCAG